MLIIISWQPHEVGMTEPILQMRNMGWGLHGLVEGAQAGIMQNWLGVLGACFLHLELQCSHLETG